MRHLTASAGSMAFLAESRFDFNKFFYEGVGYMPLQAMSTDKG